MHGYSGELTMPGTYYTKILWAYLIQIMKKYLLSHINSKNDNGSQFCTYHGTLDVVTYANLCP